MSSPAYQVGGSLPANAPSYVPRRADSDLYQWLRQGELCYVLSSRQVGKSSLRVRTMQRLRQDGMVCAAIDLTSIGTHNLAPQQWYGGLTKRLAKDLQISASFHWLEWWRARDGLPLTQCLDEFVEEVVLAQIPQNIVIFIDEIDSVLQFDFKDDFFALIRAWYNRRSENPAYHRLTFALLGVATPADLIRDTSRTPFNIGRAVELEGFRLEEAEPLEEGLLSKADNPRLTLAAILAWTGGQPFLTQKLCKLICHTAEPIPGGAEAEFIATLVRSHLLDHWEAKDDPEHLKTIRDRILRSPRHPSQLLRLYRQILAQGELPANNTPEQLELQLAGLVAKRQGSLQVYNRIYQQIFDHSWIEDTLADLKPYREQLSKWLESNCEDAAWLLRGQALRDALIWAEGRNLSESDRQFLTASQSVNRPAATAAEQEIIRIASGLATGVHNPIAVLREVNQWTGNHPALTQKVLQLIRDAKSSPDLDHEASWIETLVNTQLINHWETQPAAEDLRRVRDRLLANQEQAFWLLTTYGQILQQESFTPNDISDQLENLLGLVVRQQGQFQVANRIYQQVFNQAWVDRTLAALRPYAAAFRAWQAADRRYNQPFLGGQALQTALDWAQNKPLHPDEYQFLMTSQLYDKSAFQLATAETQSQLLQLALTLVNRFHAALDVLREVLTWTEGQSTLTLLILQHCCTAAQIPSSNQPAWCRQQIQTSLIDNWQTQPEAQPLRDIRDRWLKDEQAALGLLETYQQILLQTELTGDTTLPQQTLLELGLVVMRQGQLQVTNPIYQAVFSQSWVRQTLIELRPYGQALEAWKLSNRQDQSCLLLGEALQVALSWAKGKQLPPSEEQFLTVSKVWNIPAIQMAPPEIQAEALQTAQKLWGKVRKPEVMIKAVLHWTNAHPILTQIILKDILTTTASMTDTGEEQWVQHIVQSRLIQNWTSQIAAKHLQEVQNRLLSNPRCFWLLELYSQILKRTDLAMEQSLDQQTLLALGLVTEQQGRLTIANLIYKNTFDTKWVNQKLFQLRPYAQSFRTWQASQEQDKSQLLQGMALQQALDWARDKNLHPLEYQFLMVSRVWNLPEVKATSEPVQSALIQVTRQLWNQYRRPDGIIQAVLAWTQGQPELTQIILELILAAEAGLDDETAWVQQIVQTRLLESWATQAAAQHLGAIRDRLLENTRCQPAALLKVYQHILQEHGIPVDYSLEQQELLDLGLVVTQAGQLRVTNLIYQSVFDQAWLQQVQQNLSSTTEHSTNIPSPFVAKQFNWQCIQTISAHFGKVIYLAFSSDDQSLASLGYDSKRSGRNDTTANIWDIATGTRSQTYTLYGTYFAVTVNPAGHLLAGGVRQDGKILLWNSQTREPTILPGHRNGVAYMTFGMLKHQTGQTLVSLGEDGKLKTWDLETAQSQDSFSRILVNVRSVAINPSDQLLAWVNSQGEIHACYLNTGRLLHFNRLQNTPKQRWLNLLRTTPTNCPVNTLAISPNGRQIASGDNQQTIKLWDLRTQKIAYTFPEQHPSEVIAVAFNREGTLFASGSRDGTIKIWRCSMSAQS